MGSQYRGIIGGGRSGFNNGSGIGVGFRDGGGVNSQSILRKTNINEYSIDNNNNNYTMGLSRLKQTQQSGTLM